MIHCFPYFLCKKNSKIILYGAGNCGLEFYIQLKMSNYCEVVAWVDKKFDESANKPFDVVERIKEYNYDHIVIAIENYQTAMDVKHMLIAEGVSAYRIIWSAQYILTTAFFPENKAELYNNFDFYYELFEIYMRSGIEYGANQYYQSFAKIELPGARNTEYRIQEYEIPSFFGKTMNVLNIGCNTGFLDIQVSQFVNHITGVDVNEGIVNVARKTAEYLEINNVNFICKNVLVDGIDEKYDAIMLLAVHGVIEEDNILLEILNSLRAGGLFAFESHEVPGDDMRYYRRLRLLEANGFSVKLFKVINDDGVNRLYSLLQKEV